MAGIRRRYTTTPDVVYRAIIPTANGTHKCSFVDQQHADTLILSNPIRFEMPTDPAFVATDPIVATLPDRTLSGAEIVPVKTDDVDDEQCIEIPDDIQDTEIPVVQPEGTVSIHYEENTPASLWERIGQKTSELF